MPTTGTPWALAIGTDEVDGAPGPAIWLDLSELAVPPAGGTVEPCETSVSALQRYDDEFALRLRIAESAGLLAPDEPAVIPPVVTGECNWCPWWEVCRPQLDDDDLSLVRHSASIYVCVYTLTHRFHPTRGAEAKRNGKALIYVSISLRNTFVTVRLLACCTV